MENKKKNKQPNKQQLNQMKRKYFEFYDDIKCHTNGYEDW